MMWLLFAALAVAAGAVVVVVGPVEWRLVPWYQESAQKAGQKEPMSSKKTRSAEQCPYPFVQKAQHPDFVVVERMG